MKTTIFILSALLTAGIPVIAQDILQVEVTNVKDTTGFIMVGLFSTEDSFLKKPVIGQTVRADHGSVMVTFKNVPAGEYAISVIHDENGNGELDSNFLGLPKEGFGFGNDAMGSFGPPSFDKAKVIVNGQTKKQVVKMRYF
ncbi:MAG TPA: DUF2141 domain-containing protein [Cyclobacteriaceae bacterium]|nr:DUF2141 domain-containing protein [Cyclobacteriaceae bacterium]